MISIVRFDCPRCVCLASCVLLIYIHTYLFCMYVGMCWYPPATWLYFAAVLPYCRFGAFDLFIGICSRFYFSTFCFCIFLLIFCCFPFVPLVVIVIDRIVVVVIVMSAFLAAHVDIVMVMCWDIEGTHTYTHTHKQQETSSHTHTYICTHEQPLHPVHIVVTCAF